MKKRIKSFLLPLFIIFSFVADVFAGGDLIIRNACLIDGTEAQMRESMSILIRDGRIVKIGNIISMERIPELDVKGSYVLPGLIDGHVHLMWGPGAGLNWDSRPSDAKTWEATWGKHIVQYLRAYLACGVTTVLDAHAPAFAIKDIREHLGKGNPGPRFLTLGSFFSPPKGYGDSSFNPPVSSGEVVEAKLDAMQSLGVTGIKVPIEKGMNPIWDLPRHSREILRAIKEGAAQRKLPIYVHATCEGDFNTALDMEAHALMHTLIYRGKQLSTTFIERMSRTNTFQVSTLSVMDTELAQYSPDRLNEPLLEIVVPKSELSKAKDPSAGPTAHKMFISTQVPWFLKIFGSILGKLFYHEHHITESLHNGQKAIYDLHKAGVPIVMGSDTVYNRFTPYQFHGFTSLREIELLGEAGLPPKEVIKAATINPAKMIGLDHEIGTIEVGKRADLVVLQDNPLKSLRGFRTIQWTIKDGIAKTPKEWMTP